MVHAHVETGSGVIWRIKTSSPEVPAGNVDRGSVLTGGNLHLGGWFNSCTHLLKFLDLGLFKHREHVGIGAFCSLLGFLRCLEGAGGGEHR